MPEVPASDLTAFVEGLLQLGLSGWFILTIIALLRRWVYTRGTVEDQQAAHKDELARLDREHQRALEDRDGEIEDWKQLYERERTDRLEAQREVRATVEILQLGIKVFDQLNSQAVDDRRKVGK